MTTYLSGNRGILKMCLAQVLLLGVTPCNTEPRGASRAEATRSPAVQDLSASPGLPPSFLDATPGGGIPGPPSSALPEDCRTRGGGDGFWGVVADVRVGTVPERDRLMFEFTPSSGGVPPWELRLEAPPFEYDPTAEAIVLGGAFFLGLGFPGSRAEGAWFPKELQANFPSLVEVEESQDFHGGMYWLVALTRPSCPEVLELSGPASTCPRLLALTSVPSRPQLRPNCRWRVPRSP
jgi:hypothetical protein